MQRNEAFYPRRSVALLDHEVGFGYTCGIPLAPALDPTPTGAKHTGPFHGVELQASEMCPKSFIVFDRTDNKSRIMFHPALASNKFNYPSFDIFATCAQENDQNQDEDKDNESLSIKEDTRDIDALMSLEVEEDDEEVSTGRTMGNCGSSSPDSSVSSSQKHEVKLSSIQKSLSCSSSGGGSNNKRKQKRKEKMMKAMRRILPGGESMDTAMILDEAVRYLKSLKVEVKKLGIWNFKKT